MRDSFRRGAFRVSAWMLLATGVFAYLCGCDCPAGVYDETRDYYLPYGYDTAHRVGQGNNGIGDICPPCSHYGRYAIDIVMDEGTPIVAARGGTVEAVRDTCPDVNCPFGGGETPECCGNYVIILHEDGTGARYWHLTPGGVCVAPGDVVEGGDEIGLSGNTGVSMMPHLHFQVSLPEGSTACESMGCEPGIGCGEWGCSENASTEVAFADVCGDGVPKIGWSYTSRSEEGIPNCDGD